MQSKRQASVGRLIQEELSRVIQHKFNGLIPGKLVSITIVRMSPDLSVAKIYLSIFPSKAGEGENIIKEINNNRSKIRFELGNIIKNDLRKIPELIFYLDDSMDYAEKIDNALKS